MQDEYAIQLSLSLPPAAQYAKGHMLNIRGANPAEFAANLEAAQASEHPIIRQFFAMATAEQQLVGQGLVSQQTASEQQAVPTTPAAEVAAPAPVQAVPQAVPQVAAAPAQPAAPAQITPGTEGMPATDKQKALINKLSGGAYNLDTVTKAQASGLIEQLIAQKNAQQG